MPNNYFNNSNPLSPHTLGRAGDVDSKFDAVEAGFDKLPSPESIFQGSANYLVGGGSANAYTVAFGTPPESYGAGLSFIMKAPATNTGASTINVNGLGVKPIKRYDGEDLEAGDILEGMLVYLSYDGSNFQIVGTHGSQEAIAAASAEAAEGFAEDAEESKQSAATSASNALTHYNNFRGVYYGALSSDPSQDPNGNAPNDGDWYYNTSLAQVRIRRNGSWGYLGTASKTTFVFTAEGGETSLSGTDDNGRTLAYTVGFLQVFKNGDRMTDGDAFTANDGSTISNLTALSENDVILIDAFTPFTMETSTPDFTSASVQNQQFAGYFRGRVVDLTIVSGAVTVDWEAGTVFTITNSETHTVTFTNLPAAADDEAQTIYVVYTNGGNFGITLDADLGFTIKRPNDNAVTLTTDGIDLLVCTVYNGSTLIIVPVKNLVDAGSGA